MSDMVKYRAAIWSFLKLTDLYFTMSDIIHCWKILLILVLGKVASKTQYSPLCNCKVMSIGFYSPCFSLHCIHLTFFCKFYKVLFQQCEYFEVGNVIIEFSTSLMLEKVFQITRLQLVIWKTFSAFVMWKTQYSHVLLTVFSHCYLSAHIFLIIFYLHLVCYLSLSYVAHSVFDQN